MRYRFLGLLPLMTFAIPAEAGKDSIPLSLASLGEPQLSFKTAHEESCPLGEVIANRELLELGVADLNLGQLLGPRVLEDQLKETNEDSSVVARLTAGRIAEDKSVAGVCQNLGLLDQQIPLIMRKFQAFCFWGNIAPIQNTGEAFELIQSEKISKSVFLSFDHYDPKNEVLPRLEGNPVFNAILLGELELNLFTDLELARSEEKGLGKPLSTVFLGHWQADAESLWDINRLPSQEVDEIEVVLNTPQLRHTVHGVSGKSISTVTFLEPDMVGSVVFTSAQGQKGAMGFSRRVLGRIQKKDDE